MNDENNKSKLVPNSFQTPNAHVDEVMQFLTGDEYKVLNFATRHIMGWQESIVERQHAISLSMFEKGFVTKAGKHFAGCGLSRPTIVKCLAELEAFGLLERVGKPTSKGQVWRLADTIDWNKLLQRMEAQKATGQKRTKKAREAKVVSGTNQPAVNPTNQPAVNGTNQQQLMGLTSGGKSDLLNQTHPETHQQKTLNQTHEAAGAAENIFVLYERAFGRSADSALLVDALKDMAAEFPLDWIREAFRETALAAAKSPVKYAHAILDRWRKDGKAGAPVDQDGDGCRYTSGKFGSFVNAGLKSECES